MNQPNHYGNFPPPPHAGSQYPAPYPLPPKKDNTESVNKGLAVAVLIAGVISALISWVPVFGFLFVILPLTAIGNGIYLLFWFKDKIKYKTPRLMTWIGVSLSTLAVIVSVVSLVVTFRSTIDSLSKPLSENNQGLSWDGNKADPRPYADDHDYDRGLTIVDPDDNEHSEEDADSTDEPTNEPDDVYTSFPEDRFQPPYVEPEDEEQKYLPGDALTVHELNVYANEGDWLQVEATITNNTGQDIVALEAVLLKDELEVGTASAEVNASLGETFEATFFSLDEHVSWDDVRFRLSH